MNPSECNELGSELNANATIELCTGRKVEFPHILQFKLHKGLHSIFTPYKNTIDYLGVKDRKYDFYLGGTDSCQGKNMVFRYKCEAVLYFMLSKHDVRNAIKPKFFSL